MLNIIRDVRFNTRFSWAWPIAPRLAGLKSDGLLDSRLLSAAAVTVEDCLGVDVVG